MKRLNFSIPSPVNPSEQMIAELFLDTTSDVKLRAVLAWTLFSCALLGALVVSLLGDFIVKKSLNSLKLLRNQAAQISPDNINQRLDEDNLPEEIRPLVVQFNALLGRLERAARRAALFYWVDALPHLVARSTRRLTGAGQRHIGKATKAHLAPLAAHHQAQDP